MKLYQVTIEEIDVSTGVRVLAKKSFTREDLVLFVLGVWQPLTTILMRWMKFHSQIEPTMIEVKKVFDEVLGNAGSGEGQA